MNNRRIAFVSAVLTFVTLIVLPGTAALATTSRTAGQLNQDFGGPQFSGLNFGKPSLPTSSCTTRSYVWETSAVDGDSTYVAGIARYGSDTDAGSCLAGENFIVVAKYTSGVLDTSFDSDGYRFIDVPSTNVTFRSLGEMTMTPNGEVLLMGQIRDKAYQPPAADFAEDGLHAFWLRIADNGSDTLENDWGNTLGGTYSTGTTLNLSVIPNIWETNKFPYSSNVTAYARAAVSVVDEGGERWIATGADYQSSGWRTWYITLTDTGALDVTVDGHSDFGGVSYLENSYSGSVTDRTGVNCSQGTLPGYIALDPNTSRVYLSTVCLTGGMPIPYLISFDSASQRLDTSFDTDGFMPMYGTGAPWANLSFMGISGMASYESGSKTFLVLAGTSASSTAWASVYNSTDRTKVSETTRAVASGSDTFGVNGLSVTASGQAYLFGSFTKEGSKSDAMVLHFDATTGAFDTGWAGTGVGTYGACGDESFSTGEITASSGFMGFGSGQAFSGATMAESTSALAGRVHSVSGTQTTTPGTAPVWTDSTLANGTPNTAYSDSVAATGATAYFLTSGSAPTGLSFDGTTGTLSGTPTSLASARDMTVCASNTWGKAVLTDSLAVTNGPVGPSFANASYTSTKVVGSDVAWSAATATPGDDTDVTYSYSGTLPDGVTYDAESNAFVGVARSTGTFTGTLTATTSVASATTSITLTIGAGANNVAPNRPGWYTDTAVTGLTKGSPVDYRIHVTGNNVPTCAVTDGALPLGLDLDETCVITGTPTFGGDYAFTVTATNLSGTYEFDFSGTTSGSNLTALLLTLSLEVGDTAAGADVELQGEGLLSSSDWYADVQSTPVTIASGVATIGGNFYFLAQLPSDIEPGEHVVTLYGTAPDGNPLETATYITVAEDGSLSYIDDVPPGTANGDKKLPQTGRDSSATYAQTLAGLALMSAGLFLVAQRRRRA